ncbi:uncharacterized protein LOC129610298 [Condylostylus longicornis]|uniref:uncharacterized protein LOC129610298 n=1 Tax=Condylostylus longicornis TaxID=2530218 RepID=UPI00244E5252|nr:uncharacterized protein LOC129610298 [Condylostylus longicornis]
MSESKAKPKLKKLIHQVSIESPAGLTKDCVLNFSIPVPETPPKGARIQIICAGACYQRNRSSSIISISSVSSDLSDHGNSPLLQHQPSITSISASPYHISGFRDGALFPGFEVAGTIESLGCDVLDNEYNLKVGQRVVIYPFEEIPDGYAELIAVPSLKYVVQIPDTLPISVAAMLPSGALLAMSAVITAQEIIKKLLLERGKDTKCKILIVGTGGLTLWACRIALYHFANSDLKDSVHITVASLKDEGIKLAHEIGNVDVVQWSEDLYENQLIERTIDACHGPVDIVIDFGATSRTLRRSMRCLQKGGTVLINDEIDERISPRFENLVQENNIKIVSISKGTIEQFHELVKLVASNKITPPPYTVFPFEQASEVVRKLCSSQIPGRAILQFHDVE